MASGIRKQSYKLISFTDFSNGLNVDAAPDNLEDNQLEILENFNLDYRGALIQRLGCVKMNSAAYADNVSNIIEWPRNDGTIIYLTVIGNSIYKLDSSTWAATLIKNLDNSDIGYFMFQDKFYFTGKDATVDRFWQYDGTTLSEVVADADASNDLGPIKRCRKFVWNYRNFRIYACKDPSDLDALYYSEPNKPNFFKKTSKLYPTTGDGNIGTVGLFSTGLLAIYDSSIWTWKGTDPATDAVWERLPLTHGTISPGSVCITPSSLTMLSEGGLHALNPAVLDSELMILSNEEMSINMAENRVMNILKGIVHPSTIRSTYDTVNRRYMMAYGDDPNDANNNKILVLNWPTKSFSIYTGIPVSDIIRRRNGDILIAAGKYILKMNTGYNDIDIVTGEPKPINAHIRTKQWSFGSTLNYKKVNKMFLGTTQYKDADSTVDIGIICGYKSLLYTSVLINESFVWGTNWGRIWGWTDNITKEVKCRLKGQRFQFVCTHNVLNEPLTILGVAFNFKVKRPKGVKISGKAQKNVLS